MGAIPVAVDASAGSAQTGLTKGDNPVRTPPATKPWMNLRREASGNAKEIEDLRLISLFSPFYIYIYMYMVNTFRPAPDGMRGEPVFL